MATAMPGSSRARLAIVPITPTLVSSSMVPSTESSTPVTMLTRMVKRKNHQYSERRARPENPTYCWRQLRTASANPMTHFPSSMARHPIARRSH